MARMKDLLATLNQTLIGFRTWIVAAFIAIIATLQATDIIPLLPDPWQKWAIVLLPVIFAALRQVTTTPPGERKD